MFKAENKNDVDSLIPRSRLRERASTYESKTIDRNIKLVTGLFFYEKEVTATGVSAIYVDTLPTRECESRFFRSATPKYSQRGNSTKFILKMQEPLCVDDDAKKVDDSMLYKCAVAIQSGNMAIENFNREYNNKYHLEKLSAEAGETLQLGMRHVKFSVKINSKIENGCTSEAEIQSDILYDAQSAEEQGFKLDMS